MRIPKTKKLIIGNWKNEPSSLKEARANFKVVKSKRINNRKVIPVIAPPLIYLSDLKKGYSGKNILFGAQNMHVDTKNPATGEITIDQLLDLGIDVYIIGHAERRALGENDEEVSKKVREVLARRKTPILCIGELERDERGEYLKVLSHQIVNSLYKVKKQDVSKVIIAYEPVWTIGKGNKAISPHEIHKMVVFIKKVLVREFGRKYGMDTQVIYGGSVDEDNCEEILKDGEVKGLLIGRASANPHTFSEILSKLG